MASPEKSPSRLAQFYEFGPFRLEPDEHLLRCGDQSVPIAPKCFDLLVFLVHNNSRLLTKDQIMSTVWSGSFVEEANLTVAISALRKALGEKESGLQYIETVPKKGYRFTAKVKVVEESAAKSVIEFPAPHTEFAVAVNGGAAPVREQLQEQRQAALHQVDAGRLQGLQETAGEPQGHAVAAPEPTGA